MNLFKLSARYQQIMNKINEVDEISTEMMEEIENISDSLESKVLNYTSIIKEMDAKAQAIDGAIDDMIKRRDSIRSSAQWLKENIKEQMALCDKNKIENEYHAISLVLNNPKINYLDKSLIPNDYMRRKISEIVEPNGTLILRALKENIKIPGVTMIREKRLTIR